MARIRKTITLDEKIEKAQEAVEKTKARYDAAVKDLRDLLDKKDAQRKQELLKKFKSIAAISQADISELERILPRDAAAAVYHHFHQKED